MNPDSTLRDIDLSVLDELVALRREREALTERKAKLATEGQRASDAVRRRVEADYRHRSEEIAARSSALRQRADLIYADLRRRLDAIAQRLEGARLDREELDLRLRLGEFDEATVSRRTHELDLEIERLEERDLEAAELSLRFRAYFDAERPEPESGSGEGRATERYAVVPAGEELPPPPPPPPPEPAPPPVATYAPLQAEEPLLIPDLPEVGTDPFRVGPLTFIGRTADNQIRLNVAAVSRRHAQITFSPVGYLLRDLDSENGTWVNGERVTERLLVDGDQVQFGTARLIFRRA